MPRTIIENSQKYTLPNSKKKEKLISEYNGPLEIIRKEKAISNNLEYYFEAMPCSYGHIAIRKTSNNYCLECIEILDKQERQWYEENNDKEIIVPDIITDIIPKEYAIENNLITYYNGIPCKNKHLNYRRVDNDRCISCDEIATFKSKLKYFEKKYRIKDFKDINVIDSSNIITKEHAVENGLDKYYTGLPCKYGHTDYRFTNSNECVVCFEKRTEERKKYLEENKEELREHKRKLSREYYNKNPMLIKTIWDRKYKKNREYYINYRKYYSSTFRYKIQERTRKYRLDNKEKCNFWNANRLAKKRNANVIWGDKFYIQEVYSESIKLTKELNIQMSVDHIIPLQGDDVSGLYVEYNLGILPIEENSRKRNFYNENIITPIFEFISRDYYNDQLIQNYLQDVNLQQNVIIENYNAAIYFPDDKLIIDIVPLLWASTRMGKMDKYYYNRNLYWRNAGYNVLLFWGDEWEHKSNIILNIIRHNLGIAEKGIGARKLEIKKINDWKIIRQFLENNHLQGKCSSSTATYGGYWQDKLVGVMVFTNSRDNTRFELVRFCTDGKTYSGLASRLLSAFFSDYGKQEIISFADYRWSNGKLYESLGFKLDAIIDSDYQYIEDYSKRYHKANFRKDNIVKKFNCDITGKTEKIVMEELGFDRVYDCGKLRYIIV